MNDTHPDIERRQIEMIRAMPIGRRAALASELRNRTYWNARRAIEKTYPNLTEWEQKLIFVQTHYGVDLAVRVKSDWQQRGHVAAEFEFPIRAKIKAKAL